MTKHATKIIRFLGLILLTIVALTIMVWVSVRTNREAEEKKLTQTQEAKTMVRAPVSVEEIQLEQIEILDQFTGKLQYWERYFLEFEISGRVVELGKNAQGEELDDGDKVEKGQMLARLDSRMLLARKNETTAQWERASTNLRRAKDLRARGVEGISETAFLDRLTEEKLAQAQMEIAKKNFDDSTLYTPIEGVISKRRVKVGESVVPQATVFEIVQTDPILLVLDVPESRIREVQTQVKQGEARRMREGVLSKSGKREYRVYVDLESRDRYNKKWPRLDGVVHQVSETADERTGLFKVEVRMPNPEGLLRPGMVARASLVSDVIEGYRLPAASVILRRDQASFFTLKESPTERDAVRAMYWKVGEIPSYKAHRVDLQRWIQQGPDIIIPADEYPGLKFAVLRGQLRLVSGQPVRVVPHESGDEKQEPKKIEIRTPTALSKVPE